MVRFHSVANGESELIGEVTPDGDVVSGDEDRLVSIGAVDFMANHSAEEALQRYDGPTVIASIDESDGVSEKMWVPYEGPRGGEGYKNLKDGRVEYVNEPPGQVAETPQQISDALGKQGGITDEPLLGPDDADGEITVGLSKEADVFTVNDNPAAPVVIEAGQDIVFDIDAPGQPMYISESPGGGVYTDPVETNVMVENADGNQYSTDAGRLTFTATRDHDKLYYASTETEGMGGLIQVVNPGTITNRSAKVAEKMTTKRVVRRVHDAPDDVVVKSDGDNLYYEKEWVPYQGPHGGEGWRSTVTESIRYTDEKPQTGTAPDADELTEEDLDDAGIHEVSTWGEATADDFRRGDPVQFVDANEYEWEGEVKRVNDEEIVLETDSLREVPIPIGPDGTPEQGSVRQRKPGFIGTGIAGSNDDYLPDDGTANETQLRAEALRSAAATDGHGDTNSLESFVALTASRGEDMETVEQAVDEAVERHPVLFEDSVDDIMGAGLERAEEEPDEQIEEDHSDVAQDTVGLLDRVRDAVGMGSEKMWAPYSGPQGGDGWKNVDTGEVTYQDEPPGQVVGSEDLGVEELGEALASVVGREQAIEIFNEAEGREDVEQAFDDAMSDTDQESDDDWDSLTDGVDLGETRSRSGIYNQDEYEVLTEQQSDEINRRLRERHGDEVVDKMENLTDDWKTTSYSDIAQTRESAFMEALDIEGSPRNGELDGEEPSDELIDLAGDIAEVSREFMAEHYADEDGNVEVYRGLGGRAGTNMWADVFKAFADGDTIDEVETEVNPVTNYAVAEDVAESFGRESATITQTRNVDEVAVATDVAPVAGGGGEAEVSFEGNQQTVPAENVQIENAWTPEDLTENADDLDSSQWMDILGTADTLAEQLARAKRDMSSNIDWDPEAVEATRSVLDAAEENADIDEEAREETIEALTEALDELPEDEFANDHVEQVVREEIDGLWMEMQQFWPYGFGTTSRDIAEATADGLSMAPDDEAERVLEALTGQSGLETDDSAVVDKVNEIRDALDATEDRSDPDSADQSDVEDAISEAADVKAESTVSVDVTEDPESIDWIAESRREQEQPDSSSEGAAKKAVAMLEDLFQSVR